MDQTVLVTGGTGFYGINLCKELHRIGYNVVSFDVKPYKDSDNMSNIEYIEGDVSNSSDVKEVISNYEPDIIVHAAAALPLSTQEEIKNINIYGTRNVIESAVENEVDRFTFISSTAVYGTHDKHPITEESELNGVGPYGDSKVEAEEICKSYRDSINVNILRPKTFIGPYRLGVFEILFDWIEDGASIPLVGWGNNKYQLLHVSDLAEATIILFNEDEDVFNETYNVGTTEYRSMKEDFQALADYADNGGRVVGTPATPVRYILRILNKLNMSPLYPWVYETAHKDSYVSVEKLIDNTEWSPSYSNEEALIETYEWYKSQEKISEDAGDDHRVPWEQGVLRFVKKGFKYI
jgi:nucleoside-diphosphate-sugar epimerase